MDSLDKCCIKPVRGYCDCGSPEPTPVDVSSRLTAMGVVPSCYVGDIMTNQNERIASGCVYKDGKMYTLMIRPNQNSDTEGYVYIHDTATNHLVDIKTVAHVEHGNGFCWDDVRKEFIIAPVFIGSTSASGRNYTLTICNEDFSSVRSLAIKDENGVEINAMSVTFDWEERKTYVYAYKNHTIYEYTGSGTLTKISNVNYDYHGYDMNQGFAVRNGIYYLSSPKANFIIGDVKTGTIFGEKCVDSMDNMNFRMLGELEDWEFSKDGILFAPRDTIVLSSAKEGGVQPFAISYITAVAVVDEKFPEWISGSGTWDKYSEAYRMGNFSFTLNSTNDFWISYNNVRRPEQISVYNLNARDTEGITLVISGTHDYSYTALGIVKDMQVQLNAGCKLKTQRFVMFKHLDLRCMDATNEVEFTAAAAHFDAERIGSLTISGPGTLVTKVPGEKLNITVAYHRPLMTINATPKVNNNWAGQYIVIGDIVNDHYYNDCKGGFIGTQKIVTTEVG